MLLLATLTVTTWAKIHWSFAGQVALEDILAILFLLVFLFDRLVRRDGRLPRGAAALLVRATSARERIVYDMTLQPLPTVPGRPPAST